MRRQLLCSVAAGAMIVAIGGPAMAADMPVKAPKAAPVYAAPTWAGFYIGGHLGYGWSKATSVDSSDGFADHALKGGIAGVHAGYNFQFNQIVAGIEGDVSGNFGSRWSDAITHPVTNDAHAANVHGLASIRGRLGHAFDSLLVYGTAGWGWVNYSGLVSSGSAEPEAVRKWGGGAVYGGGVEWKYNQNLIFRLEGLHYALSKTEGVGSVGESFIHFSNVNVIRVGASYHF